MPSLVDRERQSAGDAGQVSGAGTRDDEVVQPLVAVVHRAELLEGKGARAAVQRAVDDLECDVARAALVEAWESSQRAAGHDLALTSTMSDERSQHLYRRLGYVDSGALFLPGEPAELILRKALA